LSAAVTEPNQDLLNLMDAIGSQIGQFIGRKEVEQAVLDSEALKTAMFESALDCVITMDHEGRIMEFNTAAERTFGYQRNEVIGVELAEIIIPPSLRERHREGLRRLAEGGKSEILGKRLELSAMRADGSEFPVELTVTGVELPGRPPMYTGFVRDITDRRRAEEQIAFLAYHDRLTGLPNRAMFEEIAEMAMARARRHDLAIAVLYLDLDNFKMVNDSLGHAAGDELLRQVAGRLRDASRETDLVARLGGDEFLVLLPDLSPTAAADTAESAQTAAEAVAGRIRDALRRPFLIAEAELYISTSIGISVFPIDAEDARTLLKNADAAMYQSKKAGPAGYVFFGSATSGPEPKLSLVTRLRKAVEERHWVLHYQPVVDLIDGDMVGVEALLRWNDPNRGLIGPGEFIPLAEEMGMIEPIGEWLYGEILRQSLEWTDQGIEIGISFNLSPRQLWHPEFAERLMGRVSSSGVDAARLLIEITESAAMADPDRTLQILTSLRAKGFRFAIDDFGTGFSSLGRLRDLPVDVLKIDASFVHHVPEDQSAATLVRAIVQLAQSLGKTPVAEGIETEAQLRFLVEEGCRVGQGFLFGRPIAARDIPDLARRGFGERLRLSA
jgi:diguanylate cyclase (GGDEF)-like protein/PAS domain S-box-containing protein